MAHPYAKEGHKNDPKWVGGLHQYKETMKAKSDDLKATVRNHERDPKMVAVAAYEKKGSK